MSMFRLTSHTKGYSAQKALSTHIRSYLVLTVTWDFDGTESSLAIVAWGTNNLGLRKRAPATKQQTTHFSHNIEAIVKLRAFHFIVTTIIATSNLKMQIFTSWVEQGSTDRSRMQQYCIISSPEQVQSSSPLQNQFLEKRRQEEE
jgi:hypothetical protein